MERNGLLSRLYRRVTGGEQKISPNRIQKIRSSNKREENSDSPADYVLNNLKPEVRSRLVSESKIKKFKKRIEAMLDEYSVDDLIQIDLSCFKNDGRIDTKELDWLLEQNNLERFD